MNIGDVVDFDDLLLYCGQNSKEDVMPTLERADTPGTLHHIIIREIEKGTIVANDQEDFLSRIANLLSETGTSIYKCTLISNHAHVFLRSVSAGLPNFMR